MLHFFLIQFMHIKDLDYLMDNIIFKPGRKIYMIIKFYLKIYVYLPFSLNMKHIQHFFYLQFFTL
jgi:hypothetical protein